MSLVDVGRAFLAGPLLIARLLLATGRVASCRTLPGNRRVARLPPPPRYVIVAALWRHFRVSLVHHLGQADEEVAVLLVGGRISERLCYVTAVVRRRVLPLKQVNLSCLKNKQKLKIKINKLIFYSILIFYLIIFGLYCKSLMIICFRFFFEVYETFQPWCREFPRISKWSSTWWRRGASNFPGEGESGVGNERWCFPPRTAFPLRVGERTTPSSSPARWWKLQSFEMRKKNVENY